MLWVAAKVSPGKAESPCLPVNTPVACAMMFSVAYFCHWDFLVANYAPALQICSMGLILTCQICGLWCCKEVSCATNHTCLHIYIQPLGFLGTHTLIQEVQADEQMTEAVIFFIYLYFKLGLDGSGLSRAQQRELSEL